MALRVLTWNCCGGDAECRLAALSEYAADVVVLTEVLELEGNSPGRAVWSGPPSVGKRRKKGTAVLVREGLQLWPRSALTDPSALRVTMAGLATQVDVVGLWSRLPYVETTLGALEELAGTGDPAQVIVAGDFNDNVYPAWLRRAKPDFRSILGTLNRQYGLQSAYHTFTGEPFSKESHPTLYWQSKAHQPYHIDYVFIPAAWVSLVTGVEIPGFHKLHGLSDHRPVIVDLDVA